MAGAAHQRLAATSFNFLEEDAAGLYIGDDRRPRPLGEDRASEDDEKLVAPDHPSLAIDYADAVAVAVKGYAEIAPVLGDGSLQVAQVLLDGRIRMVRREGAVDSLVDNDMTARQAVAELAQHGAGSTITRIPGDSQLLAGPHITSEPVDIGFRDMFILDAATTDGEVIGADHAPERLDILAEESAMRLHHLDAVVLWRVMRAGDHHPATGVEVMRREVEHRRRAEADAIDVRPGRGKTLDEGRLERGRAEASVITDGNRTSAVANDQCTEGPPDRAHVLQLQCFANDAADVVFAEDIWIQHGASLQGTGSLKSVAGRAAGLPTEV